MSINQEILEQIDQYLEGTLSNQALTDFQERLKTDAAFKQLVEEQQLIIRSIKKKKLLEVKKKLSSFHEDMEATTPIEKPAASPQAVIRPLKTNSRIGSRRIGNWLAVAASALLLIGSYFFLSKDSSISTPAIVQTEAPPTEERVGSARQYIPLPLQNKAGLVKEGKIIHLLITPSIEKTLKYTLDEEELVLFMEKDRIPELEQRLFYDEQKQNVYFIKLGEKYYQLSKTNEPTVAEVATY